MFYSKKKNVASLVLEKSQDIELLTILKTRCLQLILLIAPSSDQDYLWIKTKLDFYAVSFWRLPCFFKDNYNYIHKYNASLLIINSVHNVKETMKYMLTVVENSTNL